ncbi:hypothetical protein PPYR_12496 [Photinus pyralis]|uniref:Peptidase S1 domain-containing protein n=1 Tax=Photinus pyralis TaxID=7054 RepID=A0A1Y1LM08_PHOPY|nr:phenoloxidase-activating factor 1-like [Photinus pyralis]KAB0792876.1 hypothetical protein PPYR_12496 [Photinus pyralis]
MFKTVKMLERTCLLLFIVRAFAYANDVLPEAPNCGHQIIDSAMELRRVAQEGEFPWTVLLKYDGDNPFICVGSLINDRYVLTSSVCVSEKNDIMIGAVVGVHRLHDEAHSKFYGIERVIPHEQFKGGKKQFGHDIALIKLNDTVKYSDYVQPICLSKSASLVQPEDKVIVTGWGMNAEGDPVNIKKVIVRRVIANDVCQDKFVKYNITVDEGYLCTDTLKDFKDYSCAGDAGAPVVVKSGGTWYQVGIVSFGITCGHDFPDGNTRISKYIPWITSNLV